MSSNPLERFRRALEQRGSVICLGLDPNPDLHPQTAEKLRFCLNMVDAVEPYIAAVKVNENFVRDFSLADHRRLTEKIRGAGLVSIYDCKMCDIDNTVKAGIKLVSEMGYDFITFNPVMGTLSTAVKHGAANNVGIIVLLHPSNPESSKYFRATLGDGRKVYEKILDEVVENDAEGVVVGLHPELNEADIRVVREVIGDGKMILFPGVGAQGGDLATAVKAGGSAILINIGRTIIYSPNPRQAVVNMYNRIQEIRQVHGEKHF
ncbi:MAG: orotidine-5'-phosphate decarboxylase [Candidatus Caldarchaeum sp.]|uniref:Orotidine-5'-phosphate decarboxylase n=1 Tax=Caldiarchaeum subterraneum TaxID=311458 RepID=A0A7C4I707_CALS0|nr:orotidine-5'-phosphate decarboxylase [Candidatus Caldarchaeales archaeon]